MKRVIDRCPNCGVEHDDAVGGTCEVCGTQLRFWCRVHSREIGWLDSPECPRCDAELGTRRPSAPPPAPPAPAPLPPREAVPEPRAEPAPDSTAETRWRSRIRVPSGTPPPPPPVSAPPPREYVPEPPFAGRDPRDVVREGAEELRPYVVSGATFAFSLVRALISVLRFVFVGVVIGGIAGGAIAYNQGGDLIYPLVTGAIIGGAIGLFAGAIAAIRILFGSEGRTRV